MSFLQAQLVKYVTERVLEALARQVPREQLTGAAASLAAEDARAAMNQLAQAHAQLALRLDTLEAAAREQQARMAALERRPQQAWPLVAVAAAAGSVAGGGLMVAARLAGLW